MVGLVDEFQLALGIPVRLVDDHREAVLAAEFHERARQFGEVRSVEFGKHQGDEARAPTLQDAGDLAGAVVHLLDHPQDAGAGLRSDAGETVDDVGHRADGHVRRFCDFATSCHNHSLARVPLAAVRGKQGLH